MNNFNLEIIIYIVGLNKILEKCPIKTHIRHNKN